MLIYLINFVNFNSAIAYPSNGEMSRWGRGWVKAFHYPGLEGRPEGAPLRRRGLVGAPLVVALRGLAACQTG